MGAPGTAARRDTDLSDLEAIFPPPEKSTANMSRIVATNARRPRPTQPVPLPCLLGSKAILRQEVEAIEQHDAGVSMSGPSQEDLDSRFWFHSIEFANGTMTKGLKSTNDLAIESEVVFKYPVRNRSVLDIGAWNGYFSFEAMRRGAARVTAMDHFTWRHEGFRGRECFDLARSHIAPDVEALELDAMELTVEAAGLHDVVFFMGVLYHLKHPLYVLERVAAVCEERLVVETLVDALEVERPMLAFYPDGFAGDPTNWCAPNPACVTAMLRTVGFKTIEVIPHPTCAPNRVFVHAWK